MLSKDELLNLLKMNDKAVARALVVLNNRQTADEQASEVTRYQNGRGFTSAHAARGTGMAKFYLSRGFLTPKQIAWWRQENKNGRMRIAMYANQILEEAEQKELRQRLMDLQAKGTPVIHNICQPPILLPVPQRDLGNDMERKSHLEYELGDVMDSDDPSIIDPIKAQIDEIDAYWKKIRPNG